MNIEQYRAMVAEEKDGTQEIEQPDKTENIEPEQGEAKSEAEEIEVEETEGIEEEEFIEIDGEKIDIDELRNGYLRQSDYTKKTQRLAEEKRELEDALRFYEDVRNNPAAIESLRENVDIPRTADPNQAHLVELERELYDMKLENEINLMQSKYDDFEVVDVLNFASENNMTNLEDAYMLHKARSGGANTATKNTSKIDIDSIKEELLQEIKEEFKEEGSTSSIISSKQVGNVDKVDEIRITEKEQKIAKSMGLTSSEYVKWRDVDKAK